MGNVTLQGIQLYTGHGGSFGGENAKGNDLSATYRPAFTFGATLGIAGDAGELIDESAIGHNLFAIPLNASIERVSSGIWSFGGEASARLDFLVLNFDLGAKVTGLTGHDDSGLGVTPFARLGLAADLVNLEGGALAYSGHDDVSAGRGYVMANLNLGWLFGAVARVYNVASSGADL